MDWSPPVPLQTQGCSVKWKGQVCISHRGKPGNKHTPETVDRYGESEKGKGRENRLPNGMGRTNSEHWLNLSVDNGPRTHTKSQVSWELVKYTRVCSYQSDCTYNAYQELKKKPFLNSIWKFQRLDEMPRPGRGCRKINKDSLKCLDLFEL